MRASNRNIGSGGRWIKACSAKPRIASAKRMRLKCWGTGYDATLQIFGGNWDDGTNLPIERFWA